MSFIGIIVFGVLYAEREIFDFENKGQLLFCRQVMWST